MKKIFISILCIICIIALCGCASIVNQGKENITISSLPTNASFQVLDSKGNPIYSGTTPQTIQLNRGNGPYQPGQYIVKFQKSGYQSQQYNLSGTIDGGWYLVGNLFSFGITGWFIVDPLTGAMWNLSPNTLSPELQPIISGSSATK
ncbi:MAG: hypothetical protein NTX05_08310 [Fusobacteria bacterium]|nr:hypothetical protein [Fusobacteriota bacterium]